MLLIQAVRTMDYVTLLQLKNLHIFDPVDAMRKRYRIRSHPLGRKSSIDMTF